VQFPDFELLHWFEETAEGYIHISHSEMLGFRFSEFRTPLPDLDLGQATPRGSPKLRSLIGAQHRVWPDSVLVCNGASEANFLVHAALVGPGDQVLAELPLYPPLAHAPMGFGATVTRVPRLPDERWRLDLEALEKAITAKTKLVVLTNLNNPTAAPLVERDLKQLAGLAESHGFYVHVDETFRDLGFEETPPTAAQFGNRFVVTSTLTKVYGLGGLRIGWVVADPDVLERIKAVKDYTSVCPSGVSEELATWALERRGMFLERAAAIVKDNRKVVHAWLERNPKVECFLPSNGNLCFPKLSVNVDTLATRLKEQYKVAIAAGRFFGMPEHFRLGLGGRTADLEKGLMLLDMAMGGLARAKPKT
jgi:aspartate/methionine/tyrosine aminotransferase